MYLVFPRDAYYLSLKDDSKYKNNDMTSSLLLAKTANNRKKATTG